MSPLSSFEHRTRSKIGNYYKNNKILKCIKIRNSELYFWFSHNKQFGNKKSFVNFGFNRPIFQRDNSHILNILEQHCIPHLLRDNNFEWSTDKNKSLGVLSIRLSIVLYWCCFESTLHSCPTSSRFHRVPKKILWD